MRLEEKACAWCKALPIVVNLDGEDLCQACACIWVEGERPDRTEHD